MRIYLDACCLNRPFDNQSQTQIRLESEAIIIILDRCQSGEWELIGSEVLDFEISWIPDEDRRRKVSFLNTLCRVKSSLTEKVKERARELAGLGIRPLDAMHLACAEAAKADIMLTTDNKLLRKVARKELGIRTKVANPLIWLAEVGKK